MRRNAEKSLRKMLAATGGKVYHQEVGPVTHVAASEYVSADKRSELTARNFPTAQQEAAVQTPPSPYSGPESAYM